jgi:serine/threonine protein phosphatase PrpC
MLRIISAHPNDLPGACSALIDEANRRGGEDNITVVLARFEGDDLEEPRSDRVTVELPQLEEDSTLSDNQESTLTQ